MIAGLLLTAAGFTVAWYFHVRLYPWKTCPSCKGARRRAGGRTTHADCGRCKREGRVRRFGARTENR